MSQQGNVTEYAIGTDMTYMCDDDPNINTTITCLSDGTWSELNDSTCLESESSKGNRFIYEMSCVLYPEPLDEFHKYCVKWKFISDFFIRC